jgi:hypothetical protein
MSGDWRFGGHIDPQNAKVRVARIAARAAYSVTRCSWRQVTDEPQLVATDVRAFLSGA